MNGVAFAVLIVYVARLQTSDAIKFLASDYECESITQDQRLPGKTVSLTMAGTHTDTPNSPARLISAQGVLGKTDNFLPPPRGRHHLNTNGH